MAQGDRLPKSSVVRRPPAVRKVGPRLDILGVYELPNDPESYLLLVEVIVYPPMAPPLLSHFQALSWLTEEPM